MTQFVKLGRFNQPFRGSYLKNLESPAKRDYLAPMHDHRKHELSQLSILELFILLFERVEALETAVNQGFTQMAIQTSDILAQLGTLSAAIDGLISAQPAPQDLQPVADAITALQVKVATATPVAATSAP